MFTVTMLGMRAPSWLRDFVRWRWSSCVALIAGSLAFIAIVLLLMPTQSAVTARSATPLPKFDAPSVASPARVAFNASVAREVAPAVKPLDLPTTPVAPAVAPAPIATSLPGSGTQPDFASNIADRGDRPRAPTR